MVNALVTEQVSKQIRQNLATDADEMQRYRCDICGRWRFQSLWAIYQHFRKAHPQIKKEDVPSYTTHIA